MQEVDLRTIVPPGDGLFDLFRQIMDGDGDAWHAAFLERAENAVQDRLAADRQQRFGGGLRPVPEPAAETAGHDQRVADGQVAGAAHQHVDQRTLRVEDRQEVDGPFAGDQQTPVLGRFVDPPGEEVPMHAAGDGVVEGRALEERPAYVSVRDGADKQAFRLDDELAQARYGIQTGQGLSNGGFGQAEIGSKIDDPVRHGRFCSCPEGSESRASAMHQSSSVSMSREAIRPISRPRVRGG